MNSEWTSDSLYIQNSNHTKEYLFFDSLSNFYRTSLWTNKYLLEKGKYLNEELKSDSNNYEIELIDSFNIRIFNSEYDGYFHGNPWKHNERFEKRLRGFLVGDSIKQILIGKWEYIGNDIKLSEHSKLYTEVPEFVSRKLNRIAFEELNKDFRLDFTKENKLILTSSENKERYFRYIVDDKEIDISGSDYVISHEYIIDEYELKIINKHRTFGTSTMKFKKIKVE